MRAVLLRPGVNPIAVILYIYIYKILLLLVFSAARISLSDLTLYPNIPRDFHVRGWTLLVSKPTRVTTMILHPMIYYNINFLSFKLIKQNTTNPSVLLLRYACVCIVFLLLSLYNLSHSELPLSVTLYTVVIM
jgi:hypothetical protein